jgi:hypothetical protein
LNNNSDKTAMPKPENIIDKQFQKGQSGNPNGRPKGSLNRSTIAKYWLEVNQNLKNPLTGENETMSQEDLMTLALIKKARDGDVNAYKALMDSGYGAPKQTNDTNVSISNFDIKELISFDKPQPEI